MLPLPCMLVCSFVCANRTRDRGCSKHPVFPAPSDWRGPNEDANLGRDAPRDRETISTVIASKAKQSMLRHKERMDCFAALAMTWRERRPPGSYAAGCAMFDLAHGCRSAILVEGLRPTACRGMFDAMFEGFTSFPD